MVEHTISKLSSEIFFVSTYIMAEILLSQEEIKVILRRRFSDCEVKYISSKISPISESNIRGFMGNRIKYMIDQLPCDDKYKEEFKRRLKLADLLSIFNEHSSGPEAELRKTCGHGDLWFNNVFYGYENFKAVECCLVDFQIMRYFHPTFDVLMFLYLNTNREFQNKHLTALLRLIYT
ncbi:uncharacterized protein CBL_09185 [Carabus blaptoides fortunei]